MEAYFSSRNTSGVYHSTSLTRFCGSIYIYIYIYQMYIFNSWNLDCDPWVSRSFLQNYNHQAVKKMEYIYIYIYIIIIIIIIIIKS